MLDAVCTPKAILFHWDFLYGQVNAIFGLESGCLVIWWYPEQMSSMEKYFVPFNFDKILFILALPIQSLT